MTEGKINLQYPYKADFKAGYCYKNSEPRRVVSLIDFNESRTSTSYARYLMACHLGRYLDRDEHVDHINEDPLDDRIENLQILSPEDNNKKSRDKHLAKVKCAVCEKIFEVKWRNTFVQKSNKQYQTCSRSCGGKSIHMDNNKLEEKCEIIEDYWK